MFKILIGVVIGIVLMFIIGVFLINDLLKSVGFSEKNGWFK